MVRNVQEVQAIFQRFCFIHLLHEFVAHFCPLLSNPGDPEARFKQDEVFFSNQLHAKRPSGAAPEGPRGI